MRHKSPSGSCSNKWGVYVMDVGQGGPTGHHFRQTSSPHSRHPGCGLYAAGAPYVFVKERGRRWSNFGGHPVSVSVAEGKTVRLALGFAGREPAFCGRPGACSPEKEGISDGGSTEASNTVPWGRETPCSWAGSRGGGGSGQRGGGSSDRAARLRASFFCHLTACHSPTPPPPAPPPSFRLLVLSQLHNGLTQENLKTLTAGSHPRAFGLMGLGGDLGRECLKSCR